MRFLPPPCPKKPRKRPSQGSKLFLPLSACRGRSVAERDGVGGYGRDAETKARDEGREEKVVITTRTLDDRRRCYIPLSAKRKRREVNVVLVFVSTHGHHK